MSVQVNWSDRLESLADGLFASWDEATGGDPFARMCIVVSDMATRNWLQNYFLLQRRVGRRFVLANIDFVPVSEFVNDWLAAVVHGVRAEDRQPSEHPYSRNVMTWRIDAILRKSINDPRLGPLKDYVGTDKRTIAERRFSLSSRIAQLFDEYLASRYRMLVDWECGRFPDGAYAWQGVLYHMLAEECPATYAADYAAVLNGEAAPEKAFDFGFPRYAAVHVFDVASTPEAYLAFFEKIAETMPVTFWKFNPCSADWMGRRASLPEKDEILLAALASGARAVLEAERKMAPDGHRWLGSSNPFETFKSLVIETHVCHSSRRELESLRNALHLFFASHADARPGDALVLCADWANDAPLAEALFGAPGDDGYIPIALEGALTEESPIVHAFQGLVAFKDNRFTVSEVFDLLGVPALRRKFGIDSEGLVVLADLVREANIHWGYDDADVRTILGLSEADDVEAPRPYTWRRGLDRLELDALMGERPDPDALEDAGEIGRLRPCGHVESGRAVLVGNLARLVESLNAVRRGLAGELSVDKWRERMLRIMDDFFDPSEEELDEVSGIRRVILSVTGDLCLAWQYAKRDGEVLGSDVIISAVTCGLGGRSPRMQAAGDAVRFVPLKSASATPARFVWVCGLSDGTFPRDGTRPAFDFIGQSPGAFDMTPRDRDTFALLKAVFGAREQLSFSYVGRDVHSNDVLPPAVPLTDVLEWLGPGRVTRYEHPLQSYSPRYFLPAQGGEVLPPNYSQTDHDVAERLLRRSADPAAEAEGMSAFRFAESGETVLDLDELVSFLQRPSTFLLRTRLQTWRDNCGKDLLNDDERLDAELSWSQKSALKCSPDAAGIVNPEAMVETGCAPTVESVEAAIDAVLHRDDVDKLHRRMLRFQNPPPGYGGEDLGALSVLQEASAAEPTVLNWREACLGRDVRTVGGIRLAETDAGEHAVAYSESKGSSFEEIGTLVRHVAGHAAGVRFTSVIVHGDGTLKALYPMEQKDAEKLWRTMLEIAFSPLPSGLPDGLVAWEDDCLPKELQVRIKGDLVYDGSARLGKGAQ